MKNKWIALILGIVMALGLCACDMDSEAIAENTTRCLAMDNAKVIEKTENKNNDFYRLTLENEECRVKIEMSGEQANKLQVGDIVDCVMKFDINYILSEGYYFGFEIKEPFIECVGFSVVGLEL